MTAQRFGRTETMECLIFLANGLNLLSYFMKDILRLRFLTIGAAISLSAYFYLLPEPLMTLVYWNLFYVALNIFQITRITWERCSQHRPRWLQALHGQAA
jgi:hypothetical protein